MLGVYCLNGKGVFIMTDQGNYVDTWIFLPMFTFWYLHV